MSIRKDPVLFEKHKHMNVAGSAQLQKLLQLVISSDDFLLCRSSSSHSLICLYVSVLDWCLITISEPAGLWHGFETKTLILPPPPHPTLLCPSVYWNARRGWEDAVLAFAASFVFISLCQRSRENSCRNRRVVGVRKSSFLISATPV